MKKERKPIIPNELSIGRWIAVLATALGVYLIGSIPMGFIFAFVGNGDSFMGVSIQSHNRKGQVRPRRYYIPG